MFIFNYLSMLYLLPDLDFIFSVTSCIITKLITGRFKLDARGEGGVFFKGEVAVLAIDYKVVFRVFCFYI